MKLNLPGFTAVLIAGLAAAVFVLWCLSLLMVVEWQNRENVESFTHNWRGQIHQLQQKQQLWLQSQYYQLSRLAESPEERAGFQTFLLDYYQRNPNIWAVNLADFDAVGLPVSRSTKPGCLQPAQTSQEDFDDRLLPQISSCRIDDKALLEISGPISAGEGTALLLVSMDYFDFLSEFTQMTGRKLQRATDAEGAIQYREYAVANSQLESVSIDIGDRDAVFGQVVLSAPRISFWTLFQRQAVLIVPLLFACALLVWGLLHWQLLQPLTRLGRQMQHAVAPETAESSQAYQPEPGLEKMQSDFKALRKLSRRDPVTGLNTRVIFEDRLQQAVREGKRSGRRYALVLIDLREIDGLAQRRGQYIADAVLRQIADKLRGVLRESDHVARFERNLFAVLFEIRQRELLESLVEKVYLAIVRRYQVYGREFDLRTYFGVALYPDHALDADGWYQNASDALVRAESSEWPILFFRDTDDAADTSGFTVIQALRRAIDRNELKLVFQPVVDLDSYETVYFEALLRWRDPKRHEISIEHTIRLAEQNHLIKPLSNWIIDAACRFVSESPVDEIAIGINLSMIDLHDRQLPQRIETYLQRYGVKPGQIVIEITEGQIMQDPDEVIEILAHLGVMGLSLSIDDFGTGQASLTYLKELPVEKLKIDQSFVRDIASNADDRLIVKATIDLAHTLDLKVVAEGVETLAVYELLADMNCDHMQGYYISHPLEAEQVPGWFETAIKPDLVRKGS